MKEELEILEKLSRIDSVIFEVESCHRDIPARLAEIEESIGAHEARVERKRKKARELEKGWNQKQKFLEESRKRVEVLNEKLQGIRNEKEYAAVAKEIEAAKKINQSVKDEIDGIFDQIEQVGEEIGEMEKALETQREGFAQETGELKAKVDRTRQELESFEKERQELASRLRPHVLEDYKRIRGHSRMAVAFTLDERCMSCYLSIPAQLYNQILRADGVHNCPNCGRILLPKGLDMREKEAETDRSE